jgi:adenosylhomocysteine nucleosidase
LILIFYAFAREIAPFKRRLVNRRTLEHPGLRGFRGRLGRIDVAAVATGVGMARAREAARRAFEVRDDVRVAIATGVAGALTEGLKPGHLVLADRLIAHRAADADIEHLGVIDRAHLEGIGKALRGSGLPYSLGPILTSHRILPGSAAKREAGKSTGAIAVDMETAAIAEEAAARGIPFVCLRAIIDEVDDEVVGAELTDEGEEVSAWAAAGHLVRNPGDFLKLPRMMLNLSRATRALAEALEAIALHSPSDSACESA